MATTSVLAGGLIITASSKMYKEPENKLWGLLITVRSLVSLLGIGGFGLGGVLGLIGGVMGLRRIDKNLSSLSLTLVWIYICSLPFIEWLL